MKRRLVSVEEGYRRWAPTYRSDSNPLLALEERQLECLLPNLAGKAALDLGCGEGRWLRGLAAKNPRLAVGLDSSRAMLECAPTGGAAPGVLVRGDMLHVPFQKGAFNLVLSSFAIGHVRDLKSLAAEVARACAADAQVFLSDVHPDAYQAGWRTGFRDAEGACEIETWFRPVREIIAPWTQNGFECRRLIDCRFGEPERHIFEKAGKGAIFEEFCRIPAVLICHFQRAPAPEPSWTSDIQP